MKKIITTLLLTASLLVVLSSNAQTKSNNLYPNRIKASYGDASYVTFVSSLFGAVLGANDVTSTGAISAGYRRLTNDSRWALGGDFSYMGINQKYNDGTSSKLDLYAIVPTAELYYLKSGICRLYGSAGAGVMFSKDAASVAFQFNPIALRVGSNKFAGFVELGAGYKGIANMGIEIGF